MTTVIQLPDGVKLDDLMKLYQRELRYKEAKKAFYASDEGKEYARQRAKIFYERHKDEIKAKRKARYETDKDILLERATRYYKDHAEEINAKAREKRAIKKDEVETDGSQQRN